MRNANDHRKKRGFPPLLLVPVAHVASLVGYFAIPSLGDPATSPYGDCRVGCLLAAYVMWFVGGIWTIIRAQRRQSVSSLVATWLGIATLLHLTFAFWVLSFVLR